MIDRLPSVQNNQNITNNQNNQNIINQQAHQKNLNDLFHEHKLNIPKFAPDTNSMLGLEKPPAYMMPTNLTPLVTNAPNVNTAKPSSFAATTSSHEMDKRIRDLDEKKKLSSIDLENLPKEEAHRLFKDMLRRAGVTSTWKWEDCKRVLKKEDMWKAIKTFQEKRQLFNDFVKDCKSREKDELKIKRDRLRTRFRQMLEEDGSLSSDVKFCEIVNKYCSDERWRSVDERDRDDLFQDYLDDLEAKENEDRRILRDQRMRNLKSIFEEKRLPVSTKWKEVCMNMRDDQTFNSLDKLDRLKTFSDYIVAIENKERGEKENSRKYIEYKNRENFRELLKEMIAKNEINAKTKWKELINRIKDTLHYLNLVRLY